MTTEPELAGGTYEILRNRLRDAANVLRERLDALNLDRGEVFGNIPTSLLATQRVTTDHNCVPRDLIALGKRFLFGYNVQFGLKTETHLEDVLACYRLEDLQFHTEPLQPLVGDPRFASDFADLYRFYRQTSFSRFYAAGPFVYFVFQVGQTAADIKAFKWRHVGDQFEYIDNRSEHEVVAPPQHEFVWKRTTRDQHRYGRHPHISIDDRLFVETVGGDLTIKIENNTESGEGIYAEPVDSADQTLDDGEFHYAVLGNLVLLKIRPYQESRFRFLVFNSKLNTVIRMDEIEHACVMLPDDQGIIFPGGYYLQTGEYKRFDHGLDRMRYERMLPASNGEDYLYLFYQQEGSTYIQLRYNLIRQTVDTPLITSGQAFFPDGEMVAFKAHEEPQKHHAVQIWQTPFTGPNYVPDSDADSLLFKIGNQDLVRGMAECGEILHLIDKDDNYADLYVDLVKRAGDILDSYFWIDHDETHRLDEPLVTIRESASAAVEEFEKVVRLRQDTQARSEQVATAVGELLKRLARDRFETIDDFVTALAGLREQRGHAIGLRELRYVDLEQVQTLEDQTIEWSQRISRRCVEFLITPGALEPYRERVAAAAEAVEGLERVTQAKALRTQIDEAAGQLELLTETVGNLVIDDATKRSEIIDGISDVFASLNRVRGRLKSRTSELMDREGRAEFASQLKLLEQTVNGYLDVCDTPDKCDTYLTRLMIQLEELEGRFGEFDEFVNELGQRREDIYAAIESRKVQLVEARNRRAETMSASANRILQGIGTRARSLGTVDEVLAYFASDLMVEKARGLVDQLRDLGDSVRAEELAGRLKTARQDTIRQLKDRQELYEDGGESIRLGRQRFAINRQPLELTTVIRDESLCLHLTGTQYFQPLTDPDLVAARDLWNQEWISENDEVYRGEFLATDLLRIWRAEREQRAAAKASTAALPPDAAWVQKQISGRFVEGYSKGIHDHDATLILQALVELDAGIGPLRHPPTVRAAATVWWWRTVASSDRDELTGWIGGFAHLAKAFPSAKPAAEFRKRLTRLAETSGPDDGGWDQTFPGLRPADLADYLFDVLTDSPVQPAFSSAAVQAYEGFRASLPKVDRQTWVDDVLKANGDRPWQAFVLARNWADAFLDSRRRDADDDNDDAPASRYRDELACLILQGGPGEGRVLSSPVEKRVSGLVGSHPRIRGGEIVVHYHELLDRLRRYRDDVVPRFQRLGQSKHRVLEEARADLRLEEFRAKVLTSFVRNRLVDEVYLPMIGDNLAKQIGAVGDGKRTDRMGLLLLISPPGYGKTTLMEYVANRLGIVFVKINGPAIGHGVTSLDPAEAPNAAAREEVQRINLAFEMGDNVLLYLDDIQHTHPELLQKFISLCDGTRRIEGVRDGRTKTYDLRGRRFAVVMAGNPYTETGDRFQIPDMLSNRADIYNLGEIIGDSSDAFEMSYLENALTSNEFLAPLGSGEPADARALIRAAQRDTLDGLELRGNWSGDQLRSMFEVLRKLLRVRDVVLKVNRTYIRSAAQADAYRTEPPFKLQGSYRNMNRMAERVVPVMNDTELATLIFSSYEQDAQTLTTDNEANLLKLKELLGTLTPDDLQRWEAIKYAFVENVRMSGVGTEDQAGQVLRQLAAMRDGLETIRQAIVRATATHGDASEIRMDERFDTLRTGLTRSGDQLADTLAVAAKQLERLGEMHAAGPPQQHVTVQHSVPRVMLDVVRGQFHLMQEWMKPLLEGTVGQNREFNELRGQVESLLSGYARLQGDLEAASSPAGDRTAPASPSDQAFSDPTLFPDEPT
ncbi:MAG: AAA family ATPase [Planctomycetaceae bacterium]|nr:MAG: AAA family ATPase [Planctomycetaceae bacterium]